MIVTLNESIANRLADAAAALCQLGAIEALECRIRSYGVRLDLSLDDFRRAFSGRLVVRRPGFYGAEWRGEIIPGVEVFAEEFGEIKDGEIAGEAQAVQL